MQSHNRFCKINIRSGTAPISPDLLRRCIDIFKCKFCQIYGLTETTGPFTCLPFEHHVDEKLLSCGRPMFGARAKVTGANDEDLPPGEIGEICYRGESLMVGYWARPEATADVTRGDWFHSGDAGYMDKDGFIFIKDRIKDMIVSGSENVYPAEIEAVLASHPDIVECAVIGIPDKKWGETVKAVVVNRQGSTLTEATLIEWAATRWPVLSGRAQSISSTSCHATPAASCSSARCASRIGRVCSGG